MLYDNPYDEVPGLRRPYRFWFRWFYRSTWRWCNLLPLSFRYKLVTAWEKYENTGEYWQPQWDALLAEWPDSGLPTKCPPGFGRLGFDFRSLLVLNGCPLIAHRRSIGSV